MVRVPIFRVLGTYITVISQICDMCHFPCTNYTEIRNAAASLLWSWKDIICLTYEYKSMFLAPRKRISGFKKRRVNCAWVVSNCAVNFTSCALNIPEIFSKMTEGGAIGTRELPYQFAFLPKMQMNEWCYNVLNCAIPNSILLTLAPVEEYGPSLKSVLGFHNSLTNYSLIVLNCAVPIITTRLPWTNGIKPTREGLTVSRFSVTTSGRKRYIILLSFHSRSSILKMLEKICTLSNVTTYSISFSKTNHRKSL